MCIYLIYTHARISYAFCFSFPPIVCGRRVASDNRPHFYPRFFFSDILCQQSWISLSETRDNIYVYSAVVIF